VNTERLKSIDIFRGLCMSWMILGHLFDWWIQPDYSWARQIMTIILEPIGASGFLFISGVSITISNRRRLIKAKNSEEYNYKMIRNSYMFRALLIFTIAIIYNSTVAIQLVNPKIIWTWFIILTIAISLFITWPLLQIRIHFRIIVGILIIIVNQFLVSLLLPHEGDSSIYGGFFHVLYNGINQDPILYFFPFFLIGTVVGDLIFNKLLRESVRSRRIINKKQFFIASIVSGIGFIILGVFFEFPQFLLRKSFSWILYSIGFNLCLFSILLLIEEVRILKPKKSYKFLFYYSYYSFTIYLAHNILYFLFLKKLNIFNIWFFIAAAYISMGLTLKVIHKKWGSLASLKLQIGKLSERITDKIEDSKKKIFVNKY